jgi:ACT domain-containing protein
MSIAIRQLGVWQMKVVLTIVGRDRVGIIAMVSAILAENSINILNINQNIVDGFFNMVLIADMAKSKIALAALQQRLKQEGEAISLDIKVQHEDIFQIMHRV